MNMIKNDYNIKKAKYVGKHEGYCVLGEQNFGCEVTVNMECYDKIPEYCSMEESINDIISNKDGVTLESCARQIYELFKGNGIKACVNVKSTYGAHQSVEVECNE